jgi:hypothetical protein
MTEDTSLAANAATPHADDAHVLAAAAETAPLTEADYHRTMKRLARLEKVQQTTDEHIK